MRACREGHEESQSAACTVIITQLLNLIHACSIYARAVLSRKKRGQLSLVCAIEAQRIEDRREYLCTGMYTSYGYDVKMPRSIGSVSVYQRTCTVYLFLVRSITARRVKVGCVFLSRP